MLTWKRGEDAGVGTRSFGVFRRVSGLKDLVEVKELSVPPVDQILAPSFGLHLNYKPLGERRTLETALVISV